MDGISWFTPRQVREVLPSFNGKSVSNATVWRWMKSGKLPFRKVGGRRLISAEAIQSLFDDHCNTPSLEVRTAVAHRRLAKHGMLPKEKVPEVPDAWVQEASGAG